MKFYDMNLCDDVWNYVVLFCVGTVMKWYELLWKWTVVNDEMMEVDDITLGVFVSSYIYNFFTNIHIWKHWNYNQTSHSFRHDDPQRPTERTPLTQMTNDFFLITLKHRCLPVCLRFHSTHKNICPSAWMNKGRSPKLA